MIELVEPGNLMASFSSLGALCKYLQLARTECFENDKVGVYFNESQLENMVMTARQVRLVTIDLDMFVAKQAADALDPVFKKLVAGYGYPVAINRDSISELLSAVEYLLKAFRDELSARAMFVMEPAHVGYYAPSDPLFGQAVEDAFPSASPEIEDAGKCRAVGRWTACVMHLMRALETPMNSLASKYDVVTGQNWNTALNEIDKCLRGVNKLNGGLAAEQWASEASAHLRAIKNAWRNHAQHGRARYDEEQAVAIWGNVGSFMKTLARDLTE
jgi:hypothetical protein